MGDVIHATFTPLADDGAKARIKRRRAALGLRPTDPFGLKAVDDLVMDHVDTAPCEMVP